MLETHLVKELLVVSPMPEIKIKGKIHKERDGEGMAQPLSIITMG